MPAASSSKRERQYQHVKASANKRGASTGRAKQIAARTVNKERARSGRRRPRAEFHQRHVLIPPGRAAVVGS